jgi:hypothetical protein
VRRQRGHHHAPLVAPCRAFGQEHAGAAAHFVRYLGGNDRAAEAVRPVAQCSADQLMTGHHQQRRLAERNAEQRPILTAPCLDVLVDAQGAQLRQVAEQRPRLGPRQVGDPA